MIERISEIKENFITDNPVVGRIDAYMKAYGADYDFCRFYSGENVLIMNYDGEHFIYTADSFDSDELLLFLLADGLFCATITADAYCILKDRLSDYKSEELYLMEYDNKAPAEENENAQFTENYEEVFSILKSAFTYQDENYPRWYTDTCHRVRHGVSKLVKLSENGKIRASCTMLYENSYGCFLSHIGVDKSLQGKGVGKTLINSAKSLLAGKRLTLLCKKDKVDFYKKCGFICDDKPLAYQIIKE